MPPRTQDDDPYSTMPDTSKSGVPHASRAPAEDDDPYASLGDSGTPADDKPQGSAARRFLSSAYQAIKQPLAGTYHGLVEGPQNPEEAAIAAHPFTGPLDLRFERFITGPMKAEARRTAEEWKQSDPWNLHPSAQALEHRQLAQMRAARTVQTPASLTA